MPQIETRSRLPAPFALIVLRRLEQIEKLPARQQNYLLRTIDGFLRGAGVAV